MVKLFDYQEEAIKKLKSGSILWGGTGLGKSITAIAYFFRVVCDDMKHPIPLIIITTAKKRDELEWDGECAKFGLSRNIDNSYKKTIVKIDSWNNLHKYADEQGSFFIFDEQRLVGNGPWVMAFLKIAKHNQWILLSATPGDRWMDYLPVFRANGFFRTKKEFEQKHVIYSRFAKYPQVDRYLNEEYLESLRNKILVGMSCERKTIQNHKHIEAPYDKERYSRVMKTRFDPFKNQPINDAGNLCFVLRKVVNSDPRRLEIVMDILRKHGKAIIFYNYDYELDILRTMDWPYAEWNGSKHEPIPTTGHWAYFVQYNAGCEGWNCIATDTMIFYSRNYSYRTMVQAAGRIDRINTSYSNLYYYHIQSSSKIDLAITKALANKKTFNEKIFTKRIKFA